MGIDLTTYTQRRTAIAAILEPYVAGEPHGGYDRQQRIPLNTTTGSIAAGGIRIRGLRGFR